MQLRIYDDIVSDQMKLDHWWMTGTDGISFTDIEQFINAIPADDDNIDIYIHCCGGSIQEGWAMVDKLRATGKKITATVDGLCASMAVCLLLAASERKAYRHASLMIHNPLYLGYYSDSATAEELQKDADRLKADKEKILDFYVERTGADRQTLSDLMDAETVLDMERAKELGFIQEIIPDASAYFANRRAALNSKHHNMANEPQKGASIINALASLLGLNVKVETAADPGPVNYVLQTADGSEITIDIPDGQDPAVGDAASPDGEHAMPDGTTIVIVDGVITEIRPAEQETDDRDQQIADLQAQLEQANSTIADLQAQLDQANGQIADLQGAQPSDEDRDILARVTAAGGLDWLKEVTASDYVPKGRKTGSANTKKSIVEERLEALRNKGNN